MIKITQQQAINRWDTLPENLKAAIFSDYNAEVLWHICENQHLTEDKIEIIATLAGNVLMGFVHPEDFGAEIREALNINPEIANSIAAEVDRKIFNQFKADLKKVYQPLDMAREDLTGPAFSTTLDLREKPSIEFVEDKTPENKIDLSKFAAPQQPAMEFNAKAKVEAVKTGEVEKPEQKTEEIKINIETPAPVISKEEKIEENISQKEELKPEIKIEEKKETEPQFVSFDAITSPQPQTVAEPQEEAPLIIHKEEEMKPLSGKWKSLGGMFGFLRKTPQSKIREEAVSKVKIEMGGETEAPAFKVVDYSEPAKPAAAAPAVESKIEPVKIDMAEVPAEIKVQAPKTKVSVPDNLPVAPEEKIEIKTETEPVVFKPAEEIKIKPIEVGFGIKPEIKPEVKKEEPTSVDNFKINMSEIKPEIKTEERPVLNEIKLDISEIKPEIKIESPETKMEEQKPPVQPEIKQENKANNPDLSEDIIDLGMFK